MTSIYNINTDIIHLAQRTVESSNAVSPAIVPAVAYKFKDVETAIQTVKGEMDGNYYGRYGNPTTRLLEERIASLEGGEDALAVSSGMAAISIALLNYLTSGDHALVTKDVYGGTHHFLTVLAPRFGIEVDFVDCTDFTKVEAAIKPNTKVLYLETPSNPCLTILDLKGLTKLAHSQRIPVIVDNTFMTPILQKPIDVDVDVVIHSGTKYINGHGDVLAGFVIGKEKDIQFMRKNLMGDLGQNLNAWESYLILRGLKTMGLRVQKHVENAKEIAKFLESHPSISKVNYPGLTSHPQHELAKRQMIDMGGIVSFEVEGGFDASVKFINNLKLAIISFSLGDPETLVQHPASMTHSSIPTEDREKFGITNGLVRLSAGLEDAADIINDLEQALEKVAIDSLVR